jgi:hypothetical protein
LAFLTPHSDILCLAIECQLAVNNRRRKDFISLSAADRRSLDGTGYREKLNAVDDAILANQEFLNAIIAETDIFGNGDEDEGEQEDQSAPIDREYDEVNFFSSCRID